MTTLERNKTIKIIHISEATSGGVWTHLNQLEDNLPSTKFEQLFIISSLKNPNLNSSPELQKRNYYIVDMVREINVFKDLLSIFKVYRILFKEKPDILHCHSSKAGVIGRVSSIFLRKTKIVYTPHSFAFNNFNSRVKNFIFITIEKLMGLITDKLVCVSQGEYNEALKRKIIKTDNLAVIKNGVHIKEMYSEKSKISKKDFLINHGFQGDEYVIGFVGRLAIQKDPFTFLKACLGLNDFNIAVFILGDGPLEKDIKLEIKKSGMEKRICSVGYIEETNQYFENFDLFVSTSLWEGLPYAILESMNLEIPVIASSIDGVTELIEDGKTGVLFTVKDDEVLKDRIIDVLSNRLSSEVLSKNAKKHLIENYSLKIMLEKVTELYESLCN